MRCVRCKANEGGTSFCAECKRELRDLKVEAGQLSLLFEQGSEHLRMGEFPRAVRVLQKLLRRDPSNLGAYETLILTHGFLGRFDQALKVLSAMHSVAPAVVSSAAVAVKPAEEKVSAKRRSRSLPVQQEKAAVERVSKLPLPPPPRPIDMVSLGLFYRQLHQLDLAEQVLGQVLQHAPKPEAHMVMGSVFRVKNKLRLALRHLKLAQAESAESAAIAYEMGLCHEGLGQLKKAHSLVSRAVSLEPDNPHMHFTLGMLYEKLGRAKLARREYRVASSLNSAFAAALVDISFRLGLQALEEGNLERALQEFGAGATENPQLFAPAILGEIDHLLVHIIRAEQLRNFLDEFPALEQASTRVLRGIEDVFTLTARLAFYVGLSYYWDGYYEASGDAGETEVYGPEAPRPAAWLYEPVEPEGTWLESGALRGATTALSRGRRALSATVSAEAEPSEEVRLSREVDAVRAEITRAESVLGFPPVPFEFIFEEWLNVHATLGSSRVADRPLVEPEVYHRLLNILGAGMRQVGSLLQQSGLQQLVADEEGEETDENVDLGMALWATIIESFLLRVALERCRGYSREFLVRLATSERYRQRRFFRRAIRELEAALPLLPNNASLHNFLWNLFIREQRFDEALEHCQAVLRFTPHYLFQAAAYNDLAYCMVEKEENLNLALLYTEKARELAPKLFDNHVADTVAWLHWREHRYDEALQLIEQVIAAGKDEESTLMPTSIHFYHYGHILRSLGREAEAQEAFAAALEMEVDAESDWGIAHRLHNEDTSL